MEAILEILIILGIIVCIALPAYALLYFDDPEF